MGFGIGHGGQSAERASVAEAEEDRDRRSRYLAGATAQFGNVRHTPPHLNQQPDQQQSQSSSNALVDSSTNGNASVNRVSQRPPKLPSLLPSQPPTSPAGDSDTERAYTASGISTMSTDSENVSTRPTTAIGESVGETEKVKQEATETKEKQESVKSEGANATSSSSTSPSAIALKREPSLVVIACRQWYVFAVFTDISPAEISCIHIDVVTFFRGLSNRFSPFVVALEKSDAIQHVPRATTALRDPTSVPMTQYPNAEVQTRTRVRVRGRARNDRPTAACPSRRSKRKAASPRVQPTRRISVAMPTARRALALLAWGEYMALSRR